MSARPPARRVESFAELPAAVHATVGREYDAEKTLKREKNAIMDSIED